MHSVTFPDTKYHLKHYDLQASTRKRLKIFIADKHDILAIFAGKLTYHLPEGSEVIEVHYDLESHGFAFMVYNPSFENIPEGQAVPKFTPGKVRHNG